MKCKECDAEADWLFIAGTLDLYVCRNHSKSDIVLKDVPFDVGTVARDPVTEWAKEEHAKLAKAWQTLRGAR